MKIQKYFHLKIHLRDYSRDPDGCEKFSIDIQEARVDQGKSARSSLDPDIRETISDIEAGFPSISENLPDFEQHFLKRKQIRQFGNRLANSLLPGDIRDVFIQNRGSLKDSPGTGLRIILSFSDDCRPLIEIPWEFLHLSDEQEQLPLAVDTNISIVRQERIIGRIPELIPRKGESGEIGENDELTAAALYANPIGEQYKRLNLESERNALNEKLSDTCIVPSFESTTTTFDDFVQALSRGIDILHFSGHGQFDKVAHGEEFGTWDYLGKLVLLKDERSMEPEPIDVDRIAALFQNSSVKFAFLNACESGRGVQFGRWAGIAASLSQYVPIVIAMQTPIGDQSAIEYSRVVYNEISAGEMVDFALASARLSIYSNPDLSDNWYGWAVPVLYHHLDKWQGIIYFPPELDETRQTSKRLMEAFEGDYVSALLDKNEGEELIIPLKLVTDVEKLKQEFGEHTDSRRLRELLKASKREGTIVTGSPGSGKGYLALKGAQELYKEKIFPALIDLKELDIDYGGQSALSAEYLFDKIAELLSSFSIESRKKIGKWIDDGRVILFLFGLEYVPIRSRTGLARSICELKNKYAEKGGVVIFVDDEVYSTLTDEADLKEEFASFNKVELENTEQIGKLLVREFDRKNESMLGDLERQLKWLAGKMLQFGINTIRPETITKEWAADKYRGLSGYIVGLIYCILGVPLGFAIIDGMIAFFNPASYLKAWWIITVRYLAAAWAASLFFGFLMILISFRSIQRTVSLLVGLIMGGILSYAIFQRYEDANSILFGLLIGLVIGVSYWLLIGRFAAHGEKLLILKLRSISWEDIFLNIIPSVFLAVSAGVVISLALYFLFSLFWAEIPFEIAWQILVQPELTEHLPVGEDALKVWERAIAFLVASGISLGLTGFSLGALLVMKGESMTGVDQRKTLRQLLLTLVLSAFFAAVPFVFLVNWLFGIAIGILIGVLIFNLAGGRILLEHKFLLEAIIPGFEKVDVNSLFQRATKKNYLERIVDKPGAEPEGYRFKSILIRKYFEYMQLKTQEKHY